MKTSRKKEPTAEEMVSVLQMQAMAWNSEVALQGGASAGRVAAPLSTAACIPGWCKIAATSHKRRHAGLPKLVPCVLRRASSRLPAHHAQVRNMKSQKTRKRQELSKPTAQYVISDHRVASSRA